MLATVQCHAFILEPAAHKTRLERATRQPEADLLQDLPLSVPDSSLGRHRANRPTRKALISYSRQPARRYLPSDPVSAAFCYDTRKNRMRR